MTQRKTVGLILMMIMVITMIIREPNVLVKNRIYYPREFHSLNAEIKPIPAISAVCPISYPMPYEVSIEEAWRKTILEVGPETRCVFFCAQDCFRDVSAVVRSRGLWKGSPIFNAIKSQALEIGVEYALEKANKIRYYGLLTIAWSGALAALNAIHKTGSCFAILGYKGPLDQEFTRNLYSLSFKENGEGKIVWPKLILAIAKDGLRVVRVAGNYDDRELSIDIFN